MNLPVDRIILLIGVLNKEIQSITIITKTVVKYHILSLGALIMVKETNKYTMLIICGCIGIIAVLLVLCGNPKNMGFCVACFIRDTAGALGMHNGHLVSYIRPEIIGLVLGSLLMSF